MDQTESDATKPEAAGETALTVEGLIRALRDDRAIAVLYLVDGPRGPYVDLRGLVAVLEQMCAHPAKHQ